MKVKSYEEWINEDAGGAGCAMASVGVAPAGNVQTMGNVSTPGGSVDGVYGNSGSGDSWSNSSGVATQICPYCGKKKKNCSCKKKKNKKN